MKVDSALRDLLSGMARQVARGAGPVKWCKRCGRKHGTRERCQLAELEVELPSGRTVKRRVHRSRVY